MNEMEMQLSRLFNAAVGEPPNQVTAHAARRQALKRRVITCVGATAALAIAGSIGLAVSANAIMPHRVTNSRHTSAMPKFYFEQDSVSVRGKAVSENVVRSVATGSITARVGCPGQHLFAAGVAAAENQVFFVECQVVSNHRLTGTRIYRFSVTNSGRVTGFGLLPGGNLAGLRGANIGVSADGSELAVDVGKAKKGPTFGVMVINTKTGSHAVWQSNVLPGGVVFHPTDLSFARNGSELAIFGFDTCAAGIGSHCKSPGEEMLAVNPVAKGGNLSSGRRIFTQAELGIKKVGYINDAFMSPDGATVIINFGGHAPGESRVVQLSADNGKVLRTLFKPGRFASAGTIFGTDPSGRFALYESFVFNGRSRLTKNGWLDHGRLQPLKPAHASVEIEAW